MHSDSTIIIGHRNPDTDSICSAIGYAHLKRALGEKVVACRAGKINPETQFVLNFFGVAPPTLINDLYPRVRDIMFPAKVLVKPHDTIRDLAAAMNEHGAKSFVIANDDGSVAGMVSVGDLARHYLNEIHSELTMMDGIDLANVVRVLQGDVITGDVNRVQLRGRVWIAAGRNETIAGAPIPGNTVIVSDRVESQKLCLDSGARCLIVTLGGEIDREGIAGAEERQAGIVKTRYDTYVCAKLISQCVPVGKIMNSPVVSFRPDELVSEIRHMIGRTNFRIYPVVDGGRLVAVVSSDKLIVRERQPVILVDHSEFSQSVEGIEEARIVEIIDHHRLGGIETGEPIFIRHDPVGSTATIVANLHWHRNIDIPYHIAGLLLAAVLSDTLVFRSPTCTAVDRDTARRLAQLTNLDIEDFGRKVLRAGADLSNLSAPEIVHKDLKEFAIGELRAAVAQTFIFDMGEVVERMPRIQEYLQNLVQRKGYDILIMLFTDIIEEASYMTVAGSSAWLAEKAFNCRQDGYFFYLPGVVSRKKQVIPPLNAAARS
ncbi:MAG: putative manganese-dependent inorganic diphosphatase [Negativicutes bacterium]|nr:putative manganese-dependent inorganic diphosphatase [Negativicutes bacterium]